MIYLRLKTNETLCLSRSLLFNVDEDDEFTCAFACTDFFPVLFFSSNWAVLDCITLYTICLFITNFLLLLLILQSVLITCITDDAFAHTQKRDTIKSVDECSENIENVCFLAHKNQKPNKKKRNIAIV